MKTNINDYLYFPTGSNLDDQRITDLSAEPEANNLPFLAFVKQITFSLCPKSLNIYIFLW